MYMYCIYIYIYIYIYINTYIYAIMKTMDPPDHHHNGFVATHALRHMMYGFVRLCTMVTRYIIYIIYIHIYIYIIYIYI